MTKKERFSRVIEYFLANMPVAETELEYRDPYELLVAVILSAQCTDKRVNIVTRELFKRFPDADSLALATVEEVFTYIRSVSYPNNKAKRGYACVPCFRTLRTHHLCKDPIGDRAATGEAHS